MEAAVQPEDHSGGPRVHQQPQRLVAVRRPAEAAQGHEQHPRSQTEERAGQGMQLYFSFLFLKDELHFSSICVLTLEQKLQLFGQL